MTIFRIEDPSHKPCKESYSIYSETGTRKRRRHQKSSNGCDFCRRRRIKCSEDRPTCSNCSRLRKSCNYRLSSTTPPTRRRSPSSQSPGADLALLAPVVQAHIWTALEAGDDLNSDLIDYDSLVRAHSVGCLDFFFRCDQSWLKHPNIQSVMQQSNNVQVLNHSYLLCSALAVSASYLAILQPGEVSYKTLSLVLWQRSIRAYSSRLAYPESQNVDALFFASHLQSMLAAFNGSGHDHAHASWRLPSWVLSFRGVKALWDMPPVIAKLRQGIWHSWVERNRNEYNNLIACLSTAFPSQPSRIICLLRARCNTIVAKQRPIYECRIKVLELLEQSNPSPEATNLLSWFITRAPAECITHLRLGHELPLLTLLYWFRLASKLGQWWLASAAVNEFERLHHHLGQRCSDEDARMVLHEMRDSETGKLAE